jgi:GAF domain-containing protein
MERLAGEQAALRRVATLVARGVAPEGIFGAVADEVSGLFGADVSAILRFEGDRTVTVLGDVGGPHAPGARVTLDPGYVVDAVRETSRSARFDTEDTRAAEEGSLVRMLGVRSAVASPIVVEGELWGAVTVASLHRSLSPTAERRLTDFTELIATAVANAQAREEVTALAEEQAALRRVAELVAREASSEEVFNAVTEEAWRVLETEAVGLLRFESDRTATLVAQSDTPWEPPALGTRFTLDGENVITEVARTGREARADDWANATGEISAMATVLGVNSTVATPIVVEGRSWGTMIAATGRSEPLPPDTERRVRQFAGLIATAIANAEARAELSRLADEQAALRRVATLVAEDAPASELFEAVTREVGVLLGGDLAGMTRFEADSVVALGAWAADGEHPALPPRWPMQEGDPATIIMRAGGPVRRDDWAGVPGPIADFIRGQGIRCTVGAPIIVHGRMWGAIALHSKQSAPLPQDTESRMAQFTQLLETAIANADSRDQLMASRARLVTAGDAARLRVVRDLHDGAQQRLVHTIITLKLARQALGESPAEAESLVAEALEHGEQSMAELRELARGILPASLTNGGVAAGIEGLVERVDLPVCVDVSAARFEPEIEASAYFIVAEALTNVVKHARATAAEVRAFARDGVLHVEVRDDGIGGADCHGDGLVGLADRATALGGRLEVESSARGGTVVAATLPLSVDR